METIATIVKNFLIPGSTSFLLLGLLIGVAFVYLERNWSQWGRRLLLPMLALYSVMSLPIASDVIGVLTIHRVGTGSSETQRGSPPKTRCLLIVLLVACRRSACRLDERILFRFGADGGVFNVLKVSNVVADAPV